MKKQKLFFDLLLGALLLGVGYGNHVHGLSVVSYKSDDVILFDQNRDKVRKIMDILEVVTKRASSFVVDQIQISQVSNIIDIVKVAQGFVKLSPAEMFLIDALNSRAEPAVVAQNFSDIFPEHALDVYQNIYLMYGTLSDLEQGLNSPWEFDVCLTLSGQSKPIVAVNSKNKRRVKAVLVELYKKWQLFFKQK